jgi:uncharacterized heparinase superfamily protein
LSKNGDETMISRPRPDWAKTPYLAAHTLGRMHPRQIVGIGERKSRELLVPRLPIDFDRRYERRVPDPGSDSLNVRLGAIEENTATLRGSLDTDLRERYRSRARAAAAGTPTIINRTVEVTGGGSVDWYADAFDDVPVLWRLKLYKFEPLSWVVLGFDPRSEEAGALRETFDGWIRDWIEAVDIGGKRYLRREWTPWVVSLRLQHWLRYDAWRDRQPDTGDTEFERAFRREIYKNALFLRNHIEHDVGGNHLVENGAALLEAGLAFADTTNDWVAAGRSVLEKTAERQFLTDGCHFERSPMYHVLVLTRYLTACDLLGRTGRAVPESVRAVAAEATGFLRYLRPPDGRIPLLNDAVYGEAVPLDACLRYAESVGIEADAPVRGDGASSESASPTRSSGYRWFRNETGSLLVDGGAVGPSHLPGHSHSDTLSVLLWIDESPIVTDTGAFDYVAGPRRDYARGVTGHNTLQVGTSEPIALGGQYLMGPRPVPTTRVRSGDVSLFEGVYDAAPFNRPSYTHHRSVYTGDCWWIVRDTALGHGDDPARSRLHLYPDVDTARTSNGAIRLVLDEEDVATVYPLDRTRIEVTDGPYFPRFGESIDRPVLKQRSKDRHVDPETLSVLVTSKSARAVAIEPPSDSGQSTRLVLGDTEYRLPAPELASTRWSR